MSHDRNFARAWDDYWARGRNATQGCIPDRDKTLEDTLSGIWSAFANDLPRNARVLDLATGGGQVLRYISRARHDLRLTGVDLAKSLPPMPPGIDTKTGVRMEDMPFPADRFRAVTSQFGFEYGDVESIAREIARVLAPEGRAALLMHHGPGPILETGRRRRAAIRWAMEERDLFSVARSSLHLRGLGVAVPPLIAEAQREGAALHGGDSPAWEIPKALEQTLLHGARDPVENVLKLIAEIEWLARNEIARVDSLEQACATAGQTSRLNAAFAEAGLVLQSSSRVRGPDGLMFGTFIVLALEA